jgi:hypothetical protein
MDELDFVGKTVADARENALNKGLSFRITHMDGEQTMSTCDLRDDRVNAKVSNGIVEEVYRG